MRIIPAIDIRGGQVVRLTQGDYARETVYNANPVSVAKDWVARGATMIHIVDLDGAKMGTPINIETVKKIADAVDVDIQFGGGLRSARDVEQVLSAGVSRAIVGTIILEDENLFKGLTDKYGSRIIPSLDVRGASLMTRGWLKNSKKSISEVLKNLDINRFIYTDTLVDGTDEGPNFAAIASLIESNPNAEIIIAGGISSLEDIKKLKEIGVAGVILGRALYTNNFTLDEAIAIC